MNWTFFILKFEAKFINYTQNMRIMYCLLLVITQNYCVCTCKQSIYFGAFLSNIVKDDLCFKAAIDVAVRMINEDDTILKDYKLKVKYFDNLVSNDFQFVFMWTAMNPTLSISGILYILHPL